MGSVGHPQLHQWTSMVYLVLFLVLLTVEVNSSPVSGDQWQQLDASRQTQHPFPRRVTRSDSLRHVRSVMELKQRPPQQMSSSQLSETVPSWSLQDVARLIDILKPGDSGLSLYLSPATADSTVQQDDGGKIPSSLGDPAAGQSRQAAYDGSAGLSSSPYNEETLDSYASTPQLPSRLMKRRRGVKGSYRSQSRLRSRYRSIKRVLPCYWNIVTCY